MIEVYIWKFRGKSIAWGHASMKCNKVYISWWPNTRTAVPSKVHNNVYAASPYRNRSYTDDVRDEEMKPDHKISLRGLDESAVEQWWKGFGLQTSSGESLQGPLPPWKTLSQNCSTVVATALHTAGGREHATWWNGWNTVWTPNKVLEYALDIQRGLNKR